MLDEEIERFKSQNGNVMYTVKELIGALHTKIDDMSEKLTNTTIECSEKYVAKPIGRIAFTLLLSLIGALAAYVVYAKP